MRDSEVVASIVAGGADGLAEAYDRYADPLYKYCRFMLGDTANASDAVQDTFVIAASRLAGLRDPGLLGAWLYAVARNECLRALGARTAPVAPAEAPEVTGNDAESGDQPERTGLRALSVDAAAGLNPAEREVIELHLRQGLDTAEIAAMLGVPRGHAQSLLSAAMDQLEASLAVLAVGRANPAECPVLAHMLTGWDGKLTPELRWWVYPHIKRCGICAARRALLLRPAALFGLTPAGALVSGAKESLRATAGPPEALREHTLALAAGQSPSATAHRAAVLGRIAPLRPDGFPKPLQAPRAGLLHAAAQGAWLSSPRRQAAAAAGAVLAVALAAVGFTLAGNGGNGSAADGKPPGAKHGTPLVTVNASAADSNRPGSRTPSPSTRASSTRSKSITATQRPTSASPTSAPTTAAPPSPTPTPTTTQPAPPPAPGTLVVNPSGGTIYPGQTVITLTARGGTVHWSIAVPDDVAVDPSSGMLSPGDQPVQVRIWAHHRAVGERLTVSPGDAVFTIGWGGFGDAAGRIGF